VRVTAAQLPPAPASEDKLMITGTAVIMLDGASAFRPVPVAAAVYAEALGRSLRDSLTASPDGDLCGILGEAISRTARELRLTPGDSPSSTVAIIRQAGPDVDVLVLGDGLVVLPDVMLTDDRINRLDLHPRRAYRSRLAAGSGYDEENLRLLKQLQGQQAERRNREGGYWIAEADPQAAQHALVSRRSAETTPWAVLSTDGAYKTMAHLGLDDWAGLVGASSGDLEAILRRCQAWEESEDPGGQELPRAKRHDDKSIAVAIFDR